MKRLAFAAAAALAVVGQPARADEAAANFVKLFSDVCVAKFGHLTTVWDWADEQNLLPITNPQALAVFAGKPNQDGKMISFAGGGVPGSGKAWAVPDPAGRFVLATRLDPESCVVWAQKADPGEVDAAYAKMVAQAVAPGVEVKLADDRTVNIPDGAVHIRDRRLIAMLWRLRRSTDRAARSRRCWRRSGLSSPTTRSIRWCRWSRRARDDAFFCASGRYRVVRQVGPA
jgi:hypothetical protein